MKLIPLELELLNRLSELLLPDRCLAVRKLLELLIVC
jgi:hypothetical protein